MKNLTKLIGALLVFVSITNCSMWNTTPIVPVFIKDTVPSWDGEEQNSGLLGYVEGKGYLLTPSAAARYSYLTELYAKDYSPPLEKGIGLTKEEGGAFYLSSQYMVEFVVMNQKFKSSIKPQGGK